MLPTTNLRPLAARLVLATLAVANLALTGCGKLPGMPTVGAQRVTHAATIMAAGQPRKLGFDLDRYQRDQAGHARLRKLPPLQGAEASKMDLRANCSPVSEQGDIGSCTAFAVGKGLREYIQNVKGESKTPLSALFLYYETRKLRNTVNTDSGATITDAMGAIAKSGAATEATWAYNGDLFAKKPPAAAYATAPAWKLTTGVQLGGLADIKQAVARKQAVVFGMRIYQNFKDIGPDGKLPVPQNGDIVVGGHAVTVVGYDNKKQVLIIKNSFGTGWGDKGYFYMPYSYVTPDNVMDIWTAS